MEDMTIKAVLDYLSTIYKLTEPCRADLTRFIKKIEIDKDDVLLKIGDINENLYFIVSGAIHCFYYVNENPVSTWFFFETETVVSIGSFYDQVPSEDCMVALEASTLLYIAKADYDYLKETFLDFANLACILYERYLKIFEAHPRFIRKHLALDRYKLVLEKNPELVRRVPVAALATWLAIEPNTLSHIRSALNNAR